MNRTHTSPLLALLLALALLLVGTAGCNGEEPSDTGTIDETAPEDEESLPYTEPGNPFGNPDAGSGEGFGNMHENTVLLQNNEFVPSTLEVDAGVTVTFFNADNAAHDIDVGDEPLGTVQHGETLEWTAEQAGTYPLICNIHPSMTGEITVR